MSRSRRRWVVLATAITLVAGIATWIAVRDGGECGAEQAAARSPLLSVSAMTEHPDERLEEIRSAVDAWPRPFDGVKGGVGFDYGQWLSLIGVPEGLLARTKNNAAYTLLDSSLSPVWALSPLRKRTAWDVSNDRFLLLGLAAGEATEVALFDQRSGQKRWCVRLPNGHADGEAVATTFLDDGDVLVALPEADGVRVARLGAADGRKRWSRAVIGVDRADFLGLLDDGTFVVGGSEAYRLMDENSEHGDRTVVSAFAVDDGKEQWDWSVSNGNEVHIVGVVDGRTVLLIKDEDGVTIGRLEPGGRPSMLQPSGMAGSDATLRGSVLLLRDAQHLTAYDVRARQQLWQRAIPQKSTYFPYGFTLAQAPSLDETHVLMPTTTSLEVLDVRTGESTSYPLPTDGVSTTYWPYQLAVTPDSIAVVTNTGGVVARRD